MDEKNAEERNHSIDGVQAGQYIFPYHYIPSNDGFPMFSRYWKFAPSYLAAVRMVEKWLRQLSVENPSHKHMDYGCGDGGFVHALRNYRTLENIYFTGVDFDERAIRWAEAFTEDERVFSCTNVHDLPPEEYDSGTLIEVFEHIPSLEGEQFLNGVAKSLKTGALLFVTVPSTEKPVEKKHYRHFDFETLEACFSKNFETVEKFGFEKNTLLSRILAKALMNRYVFIETAITSRYLTNQMERKFSCLAGCGRIGLILRKR
ncbi:MAG: class I SAM-dependent methyltransferase [Rhodospirillales bacterium]|nr:class I SAM-dependent methyltransferase [Rhodospirillales bacterium]